MKQTVEEMKALKKADKKAPLATPDLIYPVYRVTPHTEWRERLSAAQKMTADELCDVVYAMAREGASLRDIARYYGVDHRQLSVVAGDAWETANAELFISIFRRQIFVAFNSNMPLAMIYVGKQFANQRDAQPINATLSENDDGGGLTINLNVTKANRDEQGRTIEPTTIEQAEVVSDAGSGDLANT